MPLDSDQAALLTSNTSSCRAAAPRSLQVNSSQPVQLLLRHLQHASSSATGCPQAPCLQEDTPPAGKTTRSAGAVALRMLQLPQQSRCKQCLWAGAGNMSPVSPACRHYLCEPSPAPVVLPKEQHNGCMGRQLSQHM
jgi:hypothetical protein